MSESKESSTHNRMRSSSNRSAPSSSRSTGSGDGAGGDSSARSAAAPPIPRNAKGGVAVNPAEVHQAFQFFDVDNKGYITLQDLKKRLGVFYQNLSLREYKFLMNNQQELSESDLLGLLANNELTNYDPVAEAFKIYDPNETGYIDVDVFREILSNLGFGDITDQDIQTLIDTADVDGDGRVSLNDFRRMTTIKQGNAAAASTSSTMTTTSHATAGSPSSKGRKA